MTSELLIFKLAIPAEKYLSVYKGHAKTISTLSIDGRRVEFSAEKVRRFLTHDGVYGVFEMEINTDRKFLGIKRLA
ncbi:MAG: F0F1-type ATP synthase epsilon subunit [Cycloclasticus sp.]|jgi:F0F1-type ATP synthase epsilon subunit